MGAQSCALRLPPTVALLPASKEVRMIRHDLTVHSESDWLPREDQLAWRIAAVASDPVEVGPDVAEMIANRVIDNASVAIDAINRRPVTSARDRALAHLHPVDARAP